MLVLDFDEGVQDHGRAILGIYRINLHVGLGVLLTVEAIDLKLDIYGSTAMDKSVS